jgi:PhzF family phenazine biosynthesis protein
MEPNPWKGAAMAIPLPHPKAFTFKKIDAFAEDGSTGNPAGAVYLDAMEAITEPEMLRIARELKGFVSEVGYLARTGPDAFRIRYFSSEREVAFCGHATVAILHDLFAGDRDLAARGRILLETARGVLPCRWDGEAVFIQAPEPRFQDCPFGRNEIRAALGLPDGSLDPELEPAIVNVGNQVLCVPVRTLADVTGAAPDFGTLLAFCREHGLEVVTLFSTRTSRPENRLRTRVFPPPFGYLEDPATGSGNAALGYHLHRLGRWGGEPIRIEQNADLACPNIVRLGAGADGEPGFRVVVGGTGRVRIEGHYRLD